MLRQRTWNFPNAAHAEAAHLYLDSMLAPGRVIWFSSDRCEVTGAGSVIDEWLAEHGGVL